MTKLSPVAEAVWEAFNQDEPGVFIGYNDCLAAALRAVDRELASCLFVGPDEGNIKRVIDVSDLHDLIAELEGTNG
ncbi:hypothetical protein EBY67_06575 [bacterium]|nr:hypothetical protein [bacterium]